MDSTQEIRSARFLSSGGCGLVQYPDNGRIMTSSAAAWHPVSRGRSIPKGLVAYLLSGGVFILSHIGQITVSIPTRREADPLPRIPEAIFPINIINAGLREL